MAADRRSYGAGRVTGSLQVVQRSGGPIYYLMARDLSGRQVKRRLGPVADWPAKRAKDALRDFLTDLGRTPTLGEPGITFDHAAAAWLRHVEQDRSRASSTVRDYRNTVHRYLLPRFGPRALEDVSVADVERLRDELSRTLSPRTTQKVLVLLHGLYRFAGRREWVKANPVASAERVKVKRRTEFAVLSPVEVQAVARAARGEQEAALILVAAFTGLRMGELRALRWRDVDFANRLVHVRRSHYGSTKGTEGPPKSGNARSVPLIDVAARALDGLSRRPRWTKPADRVFCDVRGDVLNDGAIRQGLYGALDAAEIPRRPRHRQGVRVPRPAPHVRHVGGASLPALGRAGVHGARQHLHDHDLRGPHAAARRRGSPRAARRFCYPG